ncbi:hypothetical protein [Nocardia sp. alder85J]|uniref:hypothetical protein n=1 Tax=Nocardia sp. alder85J TaxID=2862949 RepID=UPI001CD5C69C|nr:hypothetical protein [Nocardia sp. alder85J]MCX4099055.1 hypothetical protein [Nocardia sp. alder85J]
MGDFESGYRVDIGGGVAGQVVVGDHNVVIHAEGSRIVVHEGPAPAVERRVRPVGLPLPRVGVELLGRATELALMGQWVEEGVPVEVCGSAGVGKSALLRRFAADRAAAGRDVVFVHAAGLAVPDLLQELFQSCYDAPGYLPDPLRLRRLMGSVRALVVVDDFEGGADDLAQLTDAVPSSDLVVSTRRRIAWTQARSLELQGLDEHYALVLLTRELGHRPDGDEAAVGRLWRAASGRPRALIQAAAWLRTGGAATALADPAIVQRTMIAGLDERAHRVLGALRAVAGLPVPIGLCRVLTGDADAETVLTELTALGLVDGSDAGFALAADPAPATAQSATPADYAGALLDWVTRSAKPADIVAAGPIVVRVLGAAVESGDQESACALARKVSPVFGFALRWSTWHSVLKLGEQAALATGSAGDLAYFRHEDQIRGRVLSTAVAVSAAGAGAAGGVGVTQVATAHAAHTAATHTTRQTVQSVLSAHPVLIGSAAAVVVAAGVAGAAIVAGQPSPVDSQAPLTTVLALDTTTVVVTTPIAAIPSSSTSASVKAPPIAGPRNVPNPGGGEAGGSGGSCPPITDSQDFGTVTLGAAVPRSVSFTQLACDDISAAHVQGSPAFTAAPTSCPPKSDGTCVFQVTFRPTAPGTYQATLIVPDVFGNQQDVTIALTGQATTGSAGPSSGPTGGSTGPAPGSTGPTPGSTGPTPGSTGPTPGPAGPAPGSTGPTPAPITHAATAAPSTPAASTTP